MELKFNKAVEAADYISNRVETAVQAKLCIILGTGLGDLKKLVKVHAKIPYADIPHFPVSTVQSHDGELIIGSLHDKEVIMMAGRFHYYEGYSAAELTFPIYVLKQLGIEQLLATNVTGGVNPHYESGDLVIVKDHINLHPDHPLRGKNDERLGPRFPDMMEAYDPQMIAEFEKTAQEENIKTHQGVYVGLQGPSLETPAEYKFCRIIGGDLIGMSTVPEVIVANHCGIRCGVISIISNVCYPLNRLSKTTVEEVIEVAGKASIKLLKLVDAWVKN